MLKPHLPYLFLLLGLFLLFVVLLPKALDTVGTDHLLAFYSQAVERAGTRALDTPEGTPGILERHPDGYTGSYQATLSGYSGQLTLFGGTSIEPETESLCLYGQIQGQGGTAQLLYQVGSGDPEVLLSGHHANIAKWRRQQSLQRTLERRPDLLERADLTKTDKKILETLKANKIL